MRGGVDLMGEMKAMEQCFGSASHVHRRMTVGGVRRSGVGSGGHGGIKVPGWASAGPKGCTGPKGNQASARRGKKEKGLRRLGRNKELGQN
jgi:hypothetical protein